MEAALWLEHAIVAVVAIVLLHKSYRLGFSGLKNLLLATLIRSVSVIPGVRGQIEKEQKKMLDKIEALVRNKDLDQIGEQYAALPTSGLDEEPLLAQMKAMRGLAKSFYEGKGFGGIYSNIEKHEELMQKAYCLFSDSNALYPDLFPALRKFEAEVVSMVCKVLGGNTQTCGTMTSGGTESILMAVKVYRDVALAKNPSIKPQMLLPVSAHAAFAKAAHYFGVETVVIPCDSSLRVDINAIKAAMNSNVIMLIGSAPGYPHGVIDDIEELGKLGTVVVPMSPGANISAALKHHIGLHVDGCLGGFLLPFMDKLGYLKKKWDYRVKGVTSISCDLHKYGYSAKGASVITYANKELRQKQYFTYTEWSGGVYCSPSAAGSRPGGLIAAAWASLVSMGEEGFLKAAEEVHKTFMQLVTGLEEIEDIQLMGKPDACVVGFGSQTVDIFKVVDSMREKGWNNIAPLQKPVSVHVPVALRRDFDCELFLKDLKESVAEVKAHPERFKDGLSAVYGLAATLPDRGTVSDLLLGYTDALLKV